MEKYNTKGQGNIMSARDSKQEENMDDKDSETGGPTVSLQALEVAIQQCELFLKIKNHEDIDGMDEDEILMGSQWDRFLRHFYDFVHSNGQLSPISETMISDCKELLHKVKAKYPQYELDGVRNVWILKPGAKSRGRGIQCLCRMDNIFQALEGENMMVIQKYIERPFLVYQIKFDIRQWFLVTDWNPLTIWFYKDCYLRFCTQDYTLDNLDIAIHLSNNSVQKNFSVQCSTNKLPDDNTWTSDEFQEFLQDRGYGNIWMEKVVPGMKKAILCSLLCTQELVESRKVNIINEIAKNY